MTRYAYFKNSIVKIEDAAVNIRSHIFNYGSGAFLGIRGYWNNEDNQLYLFRPQDHFKRLLESAQILKIESALEIENLLNAAISLFQKEEFKEDSYLRGVFFKDIGPLGARLHGVSSNFSMFAMPLARYHGTGTGITACISSWRKTPSNSIPAKGKICGAYVNSALAKTEACERGFDEPILLTQNGQVAEGSASNIFIVFNKTLITSPLESDILAGITRATIIQLAKDILRIKVEERPIEVEELYEAEEFFLCGTGTEIVNVLKLENKFIGQPDRWSISSELKQLYDDLVRNKNALLSPKYCVKIYS